MFGLAYSVFAFCKTGSSTVHLIDFVYLLGVYLLSVVSTMSDGEDFRSESESSSEDSSSPSENEFSDPENEDLLRENLQLQIILALEQERLRQLQLETRRLREHLAQLDTEIEALCAEESKAQSENAESRK